MGKSSFIIKFSIKTLFITAITSLFISCGEPKQARQFAFLNSGDKELNLVIERNGEYEVDKKIPAHTNVFEYLEVGKVNILTFDGDKCVQMFEDYGITKDSANQYTCIDLEGKIKYAIVKTSYLYDATNSLAQSISDTKGGNEIEFLGPVKNSDKEFVLDFSPKWPYEKLPKKIGTMEESWALVPVYSDAENEENLIKYVDSYLKNLGTE